MFVDALQAWVRWVVRRAVWVMGAVATMTVFLGWIAVTQFRMNSDLSALINQEAEWRQHFDHFEQSFPDLLRTAVVVIRGDKLSKVERTTRDVLAYLGQRPEYFAAVAAPGAESFFRDHALLYMDLEDLDDMADRLAEAQPWLTAVAEDPSLRGVLRLLADAFENDPPAGFARIVELLQNSAERTLGGQDGTLYWTDELFPVDEPQYQLVFLKAQSSFTETLPDAQLISELRQMVAALSVPDGVDIMITGELALQHEEIEAAVGGVVLAGWLALALLMLVMIVGVRSVKIILATFSMLAIGVLWTSAYAMLSVGEYNTLSVVFIVMFFGLGVDFALHFSLRYQEAINRDGSRVIEALAASTASVGRAISLCTLTTALGFMGFWPTDYQGLADLGVISAGGMLVAWFLTFTFLPAFYALCGAPRAHEMDLPTSERLVRWLISHRPVVFGVVVIGAAAATYGGLQAKFDYSVLALKDPQSESMRALRLLQAEGLSTDYQLVALTEQALDPAPLLALAEVDEVRSPRDLVPAEQDEKLFVLEDLQQLLWSALYPRETRPSPHPQALRTRLKDLLTRMDAALAQGQAPGSLTPAAIDGLRAQLMAMSTADDKTLLIWQQAVVTNLVVELNWLRRATDVGELTFADLPASVRARLISEEGEQLTVILPAADIAQVEALSAFIDSVRQVVPEATGRPVIEWGVGGIVVEAFLQALVFALLSIAGVLLLALRKPSAVLLILLPLVLAAMSTLALGAVFEQPINMANILVLPLIFGLGVDNGIHVVDRYLGEGDVDHLMHSSTPRAVLLSSLTTIGAFAALSLSPHAGTASIGMLLTVAIGLLLVFTVFLLPVLLSASKRTA